MVSELQSQLLPFSSGLGRDCQWHCLNIFQPHYKKSLFSYFLSILPCYKLQ